MMLSLNRRVGIVSALLIIVIAGTVSGCGIRGPLVLPEADAAAPAGTSNIGAK